MLDRQDLEMIRIIMKDEIMASEERTGQRMDAKFAEQDKRIDAKFAEQDKRIDAKFAEQDKRIDAKFAEQDKRIDIRSTQQENRLNENHKSWSADWEVRMEARFAASENLVLGELDRIHIKLKSQMDDMKLRLQEMTEYYRIKKLDDVNQELLLNMIQDVERRVEVLERKSA